MRANDRADLEVIESGIFDDRVLVWSVAAGHHWHNGPLAGPQRKRVRFIASRPGKVSTYKPMACKGLFRKFSELEQTETSILSFANEYGLLGIRDQKIRVKGELFSAWAFEIKKMRRAVQLWQATAEGLIACMRWTDQGWQWFYVNPDGFEEWELLDRESNPMLTKTTIEFAAKRVVQRWINREVAELVSALVFWDPMRKEFVPKIMPFRLLGCLWWQFARAFVSGIEYKACKICGKPLEISSHGFQERREFCSSNCRQIDHRRKVKKAKALRASGRTVRQIANQFHTSAETINNWLTKKK